MADYTVYNATAAELTNINAGGDDVPANSAKTATLTDAELAAVCSLAGVAVINDTQAASVKTSIGKALQRYSPAVN